MAGVVVAGLVGVGVLAATGDRPGRALVTAAGGRTGTVDVTSTVTIPLAPAPSTPPTSTQSTTTLPKAAVDVLNALGSTTTTRPRATSTTRPAPTTTPPTPTTAAPATTTTVPRYTATLVNNHPHAFRLIINGRDFPLDPGQTIEAVDLPVSPRGDLVQVRLSQDLNCGVFDSGVIFQPGARYRVTIVEGPGMCGAFPSPLIQILKLP